MSATALEGPLGPVLFKVISGSPAPEELAAVAALLTALSAPLPSGRAARPVAPAMWRRPCVPPPASWAAGRTEAWTGGAPSTA
ncbi:acyl-CoA carboxylase epsilon subunit [Streptomyces sp. KL2]|uniref:acyl-CoA carboxylase epsilon subunit n=1 Tax=Streptomyces sp. KL2 TaxID=3050126 RepID=UPI00397A873D